MNSSLNFLKNPRGRKSVSKASRKLSSLVLENLEGRELLSGFTCGGSLEGTNLPSMCYQSAPSAPVSSTSSGCQQSFAPSSAPNLDPACPPTTPTALTKDCHQNPGPASDCNPKPAPAPCPTPSPTPCPPSNHSNGSGVLAGTVFNDTNKNGVLNGSDKYLSGATVTLYKAGSDKPISSVVTGGDGQYAFTGLAPGNYTIVECPPCDYKAETTYIRSGLNPATSGGANVINATVVDPKNVYANNGGNNTSQYTVVGVLINGAPELTSAGTLNSSLGSSAGAKNLNSGFSTFCVDMFTSMSFQGGESYQVKPQLISDINNGTSQISADHAGRIGYLFNEYAGAKLSSTQGAALQLAIWELLYDKGNAPNFTSGNFAIDPSANSYTDQATLNTVIAQATSYFKESAGHSETALFLNAPAYNSGANGYQSVLATCALDFADVQTHSTCDHGCHSFDFDAELFELGVKSTFGFGDCNGNIVHGLGEIGKQCTSFRGFFMTTGCAA